MPSILALSVDVNFPPALQAERQEWLSTLHPGLEVKVRAIDHGPAFLESAFDQALAGRAILEEVIRAQESGLEAVGLLCVSDPFLAACREAVKIPVVGAGQAAFLMAASLGGRIGIVNINPGAQPIFQRVIRNTGLAEDIFVSGRSLDLTIAQMNDSPARTLERARKIGQEEIELDGAEVLVLGCTEMGRRTGPELAASLGVPVIDPNRALISLIAAQLSSGLSHSPLSYPPRNHSVAERYIERP